MTAFPWARPVVLASGSPRRRSILEGMGVPVSVVVPRCTEPAREPGEVPVDYAMRVALTKLSAVPRDEEAPVLAADTIVVVDDEVLGKPGTPEMATEMLTRLSGRSHRVITGLALHAPAGRVPPGWTELGGAWVKAEETQVRFRTLTSAEIATYVTTGEPFDKAGGYGIQGLARAFVHSISGCHYNVVGLPVSPVVQALSEMPTSR